MKILSWNVAGFRAVLKKGFADFFDSIGADIFCLQETKALEDQFEFVREGYMQILNPADKKGYSGVCMYTKIKPLNIVFGMGIDEHDHEGRLITLEFDEFYLLTVYTPNSKRGLERLDYRMTWEDDFRKYVEKLDKIKSVIICGDLNVAHEEIDLKNPKQNRRNAGFTDEERGKLTELLSSGFTDTFRFYHKDLEGAYTWWSYMSNSRANNVGWRIDYFLVSNRYMEKVVNATIYSDIMGSDHCPVGIEIKEII